MLDLTDRRQHIENLVFLYQLMRASENLLKVAIEQEKDEALKEYFSRHLDEERGHEKWLAADLQAIGVDVAALTIPFIAVEMVGSVYYLIYHVDPAALLGYMLVMEGQPFSLEQLEKLEALHGKESLRTLRYHAEHDVDHSVDLRKVIQSLPSARQKLIGQVHHQTLTYFSRAIAAMSVNRQNS